jgi:adenosine/AMP kinase
MSSILVILTGKQVILPLILGTRTDADPPVKGIEDEEEVKRRKDFLRQVGYKS